MQPTQPSALDKIRLLKLAAQRKQLQRQPTSVTISVQPNQTPPEPEPSAQVEQVIGEQPPAMLPPSVVSSTPQPQPQAPSPNIDSAERPRARRPKNTEEVDRAAYEHQLEEKFNRIIKLTDEKHSKEMADERVRFEKALDNLRVTKDQELGALQDQISQMRTELEQAHQVRIAELEKNHNLELEKQRVALQRHEEETVHNLKHEQELEKVHFESSLQERYKKTYVAKR